MTNEKSIHNHDLVSVIIPTHNYGQYISEAIESVLAQTYKNLETIVIDDGSSDNTKVIVDKYQDVNYIYQEHKGQRTPARAINRGLRICNGKYVAVIAADDKIKPAYIERCMEVAMEDDRTGMVWTGSIYFSSDTKRLTGSILPVSKKNPLALRTPFIGMNGAIGSALIPMKVYNDVGFYDENLVSAEDVDMAIRILKHHWKAKGIPEFLHEYRMHSLNDNNQLKRQGLEQLYRKYPKMKPYRTVNALCIRIYRFCRHPTYSAKTIQGKLIKMLTGSTKCPPC